jgi:hypothetical protein
MITMKATLTFAALLLSTSLLHAGLTRTEVSQKGDWTVNPVTSNKGKLVHSGMMRTFNGKQESAAKQASAPAAAAPAAKPGLKVVETRDSAFGISNLTSKPMTYALEVPLD